MTTGTPPPAFEHDPLPEHTSHFRLLHIIRGDFGQHVECEISAWPIDNAPSYYAISYTWGDPTDTTEITVNGRPLIVRRNCEYALQQAFVSKTSKYFWVDAICIAQTTDEKNHQVGIMGQIYSGAKHVLACVGPHENDSQFLPKIIKEYRSLLTSINGLGNSQWSSNQWSSDHWDNPITKNNILLFRCLLSMKPKTRQRLYQSFCSFVRRPYFKRLWIIQELCLAQSVSYCFGVTVEAAEAFLALYRLLEIWGNHLLFCSRYTIPLADLTRRTVAYSRTKTSQAMQSTFESLGTSPSLLHIAYTAEKQADKQEIRKILLDPDLQCADPRDRLFGILSVVDQLPEDIAVPKPDYTKDRFEVALKALKLINMPTIDPCYYDAKRLCRYFQVTREDASLRNALALRRSTVRPKARSDHESRHRFLRGEWTLEGIEISADEEVSGLSKPANGNDFAMYVSAGEHEGCRSLHLVGVPKTFSISAPRGTRCGDWMLFYGLTSQETLPVGFVVRKSEGRRYNVVGQTFYVGNYYETLRAACRRYGYEWFDSRWYPEDALIFGWILNELEGHDMTKDMIKEYVNRVICAWDGSSYFHRENDKPKINLASYSSDSSVPLP